MKTIFFLLATFLITNVSYAADPTTERPRYTAGDYWVYKTDAKDYGFTFVREEVDRYIFEKGGAQFAKDYNLAAIGVMKGGAPGTFVKFPLAVGKFWNQDFTVEDMTVRDTARVAKYAVESYEQITVPAGTFFAYKITVTYASVKYGHIYGSGEYWYAPEVKNIIKSAFRGKIMELKKFKVQ